MALQQVLNSTAKHALHVFRKNGAALAKAKPMAAEKGLRSVNAFVKGLDLNTAQSVVTKNGKFTSYGKEQLTNLLNRLGLPQTATWQDVANKAIANSFTLKPLPPVSKVFPKTLQAQNGQITKGVVEDIFKSFNKIG